MSFDVVDLFLKGGFFMWPLLLLSLLSLILILERAWYFLRHQCRVQPSLDLLRECSQRGEAPAESGNPLVRVGGVFMTGVPEGQEHCSNVTEREASRWINRHERGLRTLSIIGSIAPLVGLLGTVWGMVNAFAQISALGEKVTPADFAGGIWTALLTTVAGLIVAIPAVTMSRLFEARTDKLVHDFNEIASHLQEWYFSSGANSDGPDR